MTNHNKVTVTEKTDKALSNEAIGFKTMRLNKAILVGENQLDKFTENNFRLQVLGELIWIERFADKAKVVTHVSNLFFGIPKE